MERRGLVDAPAIAPWHPVLTSASLGCGGYLYVDADPDGERYWRCLQ